jgi:hypothetical protein
LFIEESSFWFGNSFPFDILYNENGESFNR